MSRSQTLCKILTVGLITGNIIGMTAHIPMAFKAGFCKVGYRLLTQPVHWVESVVHWYRGREGVFYAIWVH